jgi:hypothetical protein
MPLGLVDLFAEVALGDMHRAAIEAGAYQIQVASPPPAAAGHALGRVTAQRVHLEPTGVQNQASSMPKLW